MEKIKTKEPSLLKKRLQLRKELDNLYKEMQFIAKKARSDVEYKEAIEGLYHKETLIHSKIYIIDTILEM